MKRKYLLIVSLFVFIFVLACSQMGDVDTWWHLKTGEVIWQEQSIPQKDIFSFTAHGNHWITHEWLFQGILYGVFLLGGINLVITFKIIIILALFLLLYWLCHKKRLNTIVSTVLLALLGLLAQGRFSERPQLFSFLFFAGILYILIDYKDFDKNRLYLLPVIILIWANIHSAFIFGITIIGIFAVYESIRKKSFDKWLCGFLGLSVVASLLNPNGFYSFLYPFKLAMNDVFKKVIVELQSPYHPVNEGATFVLIINFFIALWVASLIIQIMKKKLDILNGIISLIFLILTIMASRNRVFFGVASIPFLISGFKGIPLWSPESHKKGILKFYWGLGIFISLILLFSSAEFIIHGYPMGRNTRQQFGFGYEEWVPRNMGDFIKKNNIKGNMFNDMTFGGYLIWRLYPEQKVFIDGRNLVFGEDIYKDYWKISRQYGDFVDLIHSYSIDLFVLRSLSIDENPSDYIHSYLAESADWTPVYWDDVSVIYVKNDGTNSKLIETHGYEYIDPYTSKYLSSVSDTTSREQQILQEINRMNRMAENSVFTNIIAAKVYSRLGYFEKSLEHYRKLSKLEPKNPVIYRNMGILYYHYKYYDQAEDAFEQAVKLNPDKPEYYILLANAKMDNKKYDPAIENYMNAINLGEKNPEILLGIAMSYQGMNKQEKANEYFKTIQEKYPGTRAAEVATRYTSIRDWKSHLNKAEHYKTNGKLYNAIEEYQLALAAKPDDPVTLTNLSNLYWRTGNKRKALETCLHIVEIDSTSADAYNNLGVMYMGMGDPQKAREAWKKAIELNPESPAKENLEKLKQK